MCSHTNPQEFAVVPLTGHVSHYSPDAVQELGKTASTVKFPEVQIGLLTFVREVLMRKEAHFEALERAVKCTSGMKPEAEIHLSPLVIVSKLMVCSA